MYNVGKERVFNEINVADVRALLTYACECCNVPDLNSVTMIELNHRYTATAGKAVYSFTTKTYKIVLSTKIHEVADEDFFWETVIHEACHLIDRYINKKMDHGFLWQKYMRMCGVEPKIYHDIHIVQPVDLPCSACGYVHKVSKNLLGRMRSGKRAYACRSCKKRLSPQTM